MKRIVTAGLLAFFVYVCSASASDAVQTPPGTVVVEIDGKKLTPADLENKYPGRMFQARTAFYQAQRQALDEFIDQYLLERQAKIENLTVDELLERHVNQSIAKDPTEEMLRMYYEMVNTTEPFEKVRGQIIDHLRKGRIAKAKTAYMQSLKTAAGITIGLQAPRAEISLQNTPIRGSAGAPVMIVEYADYECPYCQQVQPVVTRILTEYKGKVALAFKDTPLPMHANAAKASEAGRCAESQGKFWEYHDALFSKKQLELPKLKELARELKLDGAAFDECLDSGARSALITTQLNEAQGLGVQGTPSFFVNGRSVYGNLSYEQLRQIVEEELTRLPSQRAAAR
jgi:protein-disulfide isomerase